MSALVVAPVIVLAAACSSSSGGKGTSPKAAGTPAQLTKITVDSSFPYASAPSTNCILDYGKAKGYFAQNGLDPTLNAFSGTVPLIAAVASGHVDFGAGAGVANVIQADAKGAAVKIVGTRLNDSVLSVVSLSKNPINKPSDLIGKKIAYSPATVSGIYFDLFLKKEHINPSQVHIVGVESSAYASALQSGQIDGYVSYGDTSITRQEAVGGDPVIMQLSDYGVALKPSDSYIVSDSTVSSRGPIVAAFLKSVHEAYAYVHQHQATAIPEASEICASAHAGIKVAFAEKQMKLMFQYRTAQFSNPDFMKVDEAGVESQIQALVGAHQLSNPKPATDYFTNQFVPSGS